MAASLGCRDEAPQARPDPLASLRAFEASRRGGSDFAHLEPSDHAFGPDPYAILPLESGGFIGLLRGRDVLVRLDASLHELSRSLGPPGASGLAVRGDDIYAVGQRDPRVFRYRLVDERPEERAPIAFGDEGTRSAHQADGLRAVALGDGGLVYAIDEENDRLFWAPTRWHDVTVSGGSASWCRAPFRLAHVGPWLVSACLVDHSIVAARVDARGVPDVEHVARAVHDGPFWGFDAAIDGDELVVVAGGVEDRALDRTGGSFGYVDSFVFELRLRAGEPAFREIAAINTSAHEVVVPKAISLGRSQDGALVARVLGAGSAKALDWPLGSAEVREVEGVPGASAVIAVGEGFVAADPLLDAWVRFDHGRLDVVAVPDPGAKPRDPEARLGEALVFTTSMAPWNKSDGELSRFTCETCHFEGTVDGRTHATGRGHVVATTKPLLGLFNNRPHFSRALDPDLATVAENEFRVAGARSDHDPHFSLGPKEAPWLGYLGVDRERSPEELRRAFMAFFMDFTPRKNARTARRQRFDAVEAKGAAAFRDRCERCHEARLASDEPALREPFDMWETRIFAEDAPIVWASDRYEKTGVEPYVHEKGARVPSLRRLARKRPYFTNGTARGLADVLEGVRFDANGFWHAAGPPSATALAPDEREALVAFLRLL